MRIHKKTGPKPSFDKDDVINAALAIGMNAFTMSEVAKRLNVATSALYRIYSRDALLDACIERVATENSFDGADTWQETVRTYGNYLWNNCEKYEGFSAILLNYPGVHRHFNKSMNSFLDALQADGFSKSEALFTLEFVANIVIGTHNGVSAYRRPAQDGMSGLEWANQQFPENYPLRPDERWIERGSLDEKIEFIIKGLETYRPAI